MSDASGLHRAFGVREGRWTGTVTDDGMSVVVSRHWTRALRTFFHQSLTGQARQGFPSLFCRLREVSSFVQGSTCIPEGAGTQVITLPSECLRVTADTASSTDGRLAGAADRGRCVSKYPRPWQVAGRMTPLFERMNE